MHCIRGDAMATTPNTNHNRQLHGCRTCTGHHQGQHVLGHGYACIHWIQDWAQQCQFLVIWAPGKLNKVDYFTKLHAPIHHHHMCFVCLHPPSLPTNPAHLCLTNLSCGCALNPGFHPRAGHPDVASIPQVNYSTSQRQLPSTPVEVYYLKKTPITTKPVLHTN